MTFQDPLSYNDFESATSDNELNDPESGCDKVDEDQMSYEYSSEQKINSLKMKIVVMNGVVTSMASNTFSMKTATNRPPRIPFQRTKNIPLKMQGKFTIKNPHPLNIQYKEATRNLRPWRVTNHQIVSLQISNFRITTFKMRMNMRCTPNSISQTINTAPRHILKIAFKLMTNTTARIPNMMVSLQRIFHMIPRNLYPQVTIENETKMASTICTP